MHTINELNYPALRYYNYVTFAKHPDFAPFFRELTTNETLNEIIKHPDDPVVSICKKMPDAYTLKEEMNGRTLQSFPFFKVPADDIDTLDDEQIQFLWYMFTRMWTLEFYNKQPEIVKGSTWDEMYYNNVPGYDEWLDDKAKNGFNSSGIIIRPHEQVCEFYKISYMHNKCIEISFCFHGSELVWGHINFDGFLSSVLELPKTLDIIAKQRKVTRQEAYFQEDMYNILRWLYFKEFHGMKPKAIVPFKKFFDKSGYADFRMATSTPCVICEKPVAS